MAMTERRYTDEEVAEIFRSAAEGPATSRCASRFPPTLSLRSRKIAEARVAIQMHECLGRANARLTTAPLRHDPAGGVALRGANSCRLVQRFSGNAALATGEVDDGDRVSEGRIQ